MEILGSEANLKKFEIKMNDFQKKALPKLKAMLTRKIKDTLEDWLPIYSVIETECKSMGLQVDNLAVYNPVKFKSNTKIRIRIFAPDLNVMVESVSYTQMDPRLAIIKNTLLTAMIDLESVE